MKNLEKQKIIDQCKKILTKHYIQADVFKYIVRDYGHNFYIDVKKNGKMFYEFCSVYCDGDYNIVQYNIEMHDGRF